MFAHPICSIDSVQGTYRPCKRRNVFENSNSIYLGLIQYFLSGNISQYIEEFLRSGFITFYPRPNVKNYVHLTR